MRRRLSREQFFHLCQWMQNKHELLVENAPNSVEIAKIASRELQFDVADKPCREAIKAAGVAYNPRVVQGHASSKKAHVRIDALDKQMVQMAAKCMEMSAELAILRGVIRDAIGPLPGDPKPFTASINGKR